MASINSVIDTLLVDVLGKRVNFRHSPKGPPPVNGSFNTALNGTANSRSSVSYQAFVAGQGGATTLPASGATSTPSTSEAGALSMLSPAGRKIAALMAMLSTEASVVRQKERPLDGAAPRTPDVSTRIQNSIRNSGLFYESHVARWFLGEEPVETLRRQPQMRFGIGSPEAERVFRHQLEMLANPTLRWEGQVYPGLVAAFCLQMPDQRREQHSSATSESDAEDGDGQTLGVTLRLDVEGFGRFHVELIFKGDRLWAEVLVDDERLLYITRRRTKSLLDKLYFYGFSKPALTIAYQEELPGEWPKP